MTIFADITRSQKVTVIKYDLILYSMHSWGILLCVFFSLGFIIIGLSFAPVYAEHDDVGCPRGMDELLVEDIPEPFRAAADKMDRNDNGEVCFNPRNGMFIDDRVPMK